MYEHIFTIEGIWNNRGTVIVIIIIIIIILGLT